MAAMTALAMVLGLLGLAGAQRPVELWASVTEDKPHVRPLYASMAGDDPSSGKNWSSKPKQQVDAWNKTMHNTYHKYIPSSYRELPSKAAEIRASTAASGDEQKFKGYSHDYGSLAKVAMHGAKRDRARGPRHHSAPPRGEGVPDYHQYMDQYSQESTESGPAEVPDFQQYMGNYLAEGEAPPSKAPRGEASGEASHGQAAEISTKADTAPMDEVPDFHQYMDEYAAGSQTSDKADQSGATQMDDMADFHQYMDSYVSSNHAADKAAKADKTHHNDYADAGIEATHEDWGKTYGHAGGWHDQLRSVVPSFVRFDAVPAEGQRNLRLQQAKDVPWPAFLFILPMAAAVYHLAFLRCRRRVHPPESLLG